MAQRDVTLPGAGRLKEDNFFLFLDLQILKSHPEYEMFAQTNKIADILIGIDVLLTDTDDLKSKYEKDLDDLWQEFDELIKNHYDFNAIEGTQGWKNEYWRLLTHLKAKLIKLQRKGRLLKTLEGEVYGGDLDDDE